MSDDLNPLDYHFWDAVQKLVYEGRERQPFENLAQLSRRIRRVWAKACNMDHIRKAIDQFRPRFKKVVACEGDRIKQYFG